MAASKTSNPLVSIVMSTYRDSEYTLLRAVESVLSQTFTALELILVFEPGDGNAKRIQRIYDDKRLKVVRSKSHMGRCNAYNLGISLAKGRYIARMDSDDVCFRGRIMRQVSFLQDNPDISIVGSSAVLVSDTGKYLGLRRYPLNHSDCISALSLTNPLLHPTIMWDGDKVGEDGWFNPRYNRACDDLDLFLRLLGKSI